MYIQSASKMVNSRMHSLTCTRIFYSKSSLVSTHFAQITREKFNMNPGEKQAEIYTYEAPWLIYACNWSVRLRSFSLYVCESHICRSFSLSFSLCVREMEFQSGAALYSLRNGIQIISTMVCTLCCTRRSIRANFN